LKFDQRRLRSGGEDEGNQASIPAADTETRRLGPPPAVLVRPVWRRAPAAGRRLGPQAGAGVRTSSGGRGRQLKGGRVWLCRRVIHSAESSVRREDGPASAQAVGGPDPSLRRWRETSARQHGRKSVSAGLAEAGRGFRRCDLTGRPGRPGCFWPRTDSDSAFHSRPAPGAAPRRPSLCCLARPPFDHDPCFSRPAARSRDGSEGTEAYRLFPRRTLTRRSRAVWPLPPAS